MSSAKITMSGRMIATAVAAVAVAATTTGSANAAPEAAQAFKAAHIDRCLSSYTAGGLEWRSPSPTPTPVPSYAVTVTGEVALRNVGMCAFPTIPTAVAVFTAYNGREVVDSERRSTTSAARFEFVLAQANNPTPPTLRIDRVTVQVCHTAGVNDPTSVPITCGAIATYIP